MKGLFIFLVFLLLLDSALATDVNFTLKYTNGSFVNGGTLNLHEYNAPGGVLKHVYNQTLTNTSNSTGYVTISGVTNTTQKYYRIESYYNSSYRGNLKTNVTHVSPVLWQMRSDILQYGLSGSNITLEPAISINFSVNNGTSLVLMGRGYDVVDALHGNHLLTARDTTTLVNLIFLPRNGTYMFSVHPNESAPQVITYRPEQTYNTNCDMNASSAYNGKIFNCELNGSVQLRNIYGYINTSTTTSFDEVNGTNYLIGLNRTYDEAFFRNLGNLARFNVGNDTYNRTTGYFNVSVPATELGTDSLLLFYGRNGSTNYGGIFNITANLSNTTPYNASTITMVPMYGVNKSNTLTDFQLTKINLTTNYTSFNISLNGSRTFVEGLYVEIDVTYPNNKTIKWTYSNPLGQIDVPLLTNSAVDLRAFALGTSPQRTKYSSSQLAGNYIFFTTLKNFDRDNPDGNEDISALDIELFDYNNASCNVAIPPPSCRILNYSDTNASNIAYDVYKSMLLGRSNVRIKDRATNASVMYVGTDLRHSNFPPVFMGDSADTDNSTTTSFDETWRLGSKGPEMYDYVFASIPYDNDSLNESKGVNVSLSTLFDTESSSTWNNLWNITKNATSAINNLSDYSAEYSEWEYLVDGSACATTLASISATDPCGINTSTDLLYLRIPHFSAGGFKFDGLVPVTNTDSDDDGGSGGSPLIMKGGGGSGGGSAGSGGSDDSEEESSEDGDSGEESEDGVDIGLEESPAPGLGENIIDLIKENFKHILIKDNMRLGISGGVLVVVIVLLVVIYRHKIIS